MRTWIIALTIAAAAGGLAASRTIGYAQEQQRGRVDFVMLCGNSPESLASQASARSAGSPVGGPFVHRDQVCVLWRN